VYWRATGVLIRAVLIAWGCSQIIYFHRRTEHEKRAPSQAASKNEAMLHAPEAPKVQWQSDTDPQLQAQQRHSLERMKGTGIRAWLIKYLSQTNQQAPYWDISNLEKRNLSKILVYTSISNGWEFHKQSANCEWCNLAKARASRQTVVVIYPQNNNVSIQQSIDTLVRTAKYGTYPSHLGIKWHSTRTIQEKALPGHMTQLANVNKETYPTPQIGTSKSTRHDSHDKYK